MVFIKYLICITNKMGKLSVVLLACVLNCVYAGRSDSCCKFNTVFDKEQQICTDTSTGETSEIIFKCGGTLHLLTPYYFDGDDILWEAQLYDNSFTNITLEKNQYCMDNSTDPLNVTQSAYYCEEEEPISTKQYVTYSCGLVSTVFLLLTAFIYFVIPEIRDLQGKSIICFCITLSCSLIILAVEHFGGQVELVHCATRGFLIYYFILTTFFWMNAISIQVVVYIKKPNVSRGVREFLWYALYAFGAPTLLTACLIITNFIEGDHMKPGIGLGLCWFYSNVEKWVFMNSILSIIIAVNVCLFVYASSLLWRHTFSSSVVKSLRFRFTMMLRMFVVMGLPWVCEMISSLVPDDDALTIILDITTMLQGPLIFVVLVVCRKRVVSALLRGGWLACCAARVERHLAARADHEPDDDFTQVQLDDHHDLTHTQVLR